MEQPDFTDRYNTKLSPEDESKFRIWARLQGRTSDLRDYDLRGAWKASSSEAANGHLPDTFKKPNHPTFSTESQYNGVDGQTGGTWGGDDKHGWSFTPSPSNLRNMSPAELQAYFREVEPDSKLILPPDRSQRLYPNDQPRP